MHPATWLWHRLLRRAGLLDSITYIEWMADTWPKPTARPVGPQQAAAEGVRQVRA